MSNSFLIKFLLFCSIGYIAVLPISDVLTYIFRIPGLICITLLTINNYSQSKPKYAIPLIIVLLLCLINTIMLDSGITFELFLSILSVFGLLFLIIISSTFRIDDRLEKSIYRLSVLGAIVLTIHSFAPYSHFTGTFMCPYLTYGFDNSNFAGITTFLLYSAVLITANYKKKINLIITLAIAGWLLYLIFLTYCRSAFVAALFVPIAMVLFARYRLPNILLYMACAIPFIFVPFYLNFTDHASENVEIMGKGVISGREEVYRTFLDDIKYGYQYIIGTFHSKPFSNAHNGPLAYFVSLGVLGVLSVYKILIDKLRLANRQVINKNAKCAVFVVLAVFIESCGESSLFLGGFPGIAYLFLFYIMAASNNGKYNQI